MADYAQTISNNLPLMAISPAVYWGALTWGTDNWGRDEDAITDTDKGIPNTITQTLTHTQDIEHLLANGDTLQLSDVIANSLSLTPIGNSISLVSSLADIRRSIADWDYVFTKPTSVGVDAIYDESSKVANASSTWSAVSNNSTSWSDA